MLDFIALAFGLLAVAELVMTSLAFLLVCGISRKLFPKFRKHDLFLVYFAILLYISYTMVYLFSVHDLQRLFASFNVLIASVLLFFSALIVFFKVRKIILSKSVLHA